MDVEIFRTLKPFSDLSNPTNTIYDHLPYKKDITLVKESDVRMESGNILKFQRVVSEEPVLINTNPLANAKINEFISSVSEVDYPYNMEEEEENGLPDTSSNPLLEEMPLPIEPVNSFANVDEDSDDYSFLRD